MENLSLKDMKLLWVFGALERLATLGFIGETPYKVSQNTIDLYLELDENRNNLFPDDRELKEMLAVIIPKINGGELDKDILDGFYILLKDYKNNRKKIVKYSLNNIILS